MQDLQKRQRIEQILRTSLNYREDADNINSFDSVFIGNFIDKLTKKDMTKSKYDLKSLIIVDYLSNGKDKSKRLNNGDISLNYSANKYLTLINNKQASDEILKAETKEDLKGILYLDDLISKIDDGDVWSITGSFNSIREKANFLEDYSTELSHLGKSDIYLSSSYQTLNHFSSDFTLAAVKQIKKIDNELTNSITDYKTIIKNPKLIKKINTVKSRAKDLKRYTSNWLNIKLKTYLEKEYKHINFNISSAKSLDFAIKKTDNASLQLNQIKQKYKAAGMRSTKLNQKYSKLSAQQNKLKGYNALKKEFVKNCAIIKRDRQMIEDAGLDDISNLISLIDKRKEILKNADISETNFTDLNTAKQDYVNESKMFRDTVNNEINSIRHYLNSNCNILIKKADKYTGLSGLFVKKDQETLMRLKDEVKRLNNQILLVKNKFGVLGYVIQKSNDLDNLVNKIIRKNKYTYSQKLKQNLGFKYAGARLLAFTYFPPKKIIGEDIKTTRKTYSLSLSRKRKKLGMMALAGAISLIVCHGMYFDANSFTAKAMYQQVSNIESTVKYHPNQNKTKSVSRQIEIKKPQSKNIKKYVEQMHEKYELRFTEIRQRFDMADTEKKYDLAQKQLDNLKTEMKQFMGTEIYQKYKSGKV